MAEKFPQRVLSLSTIAEHATVEVDGQLHDLVNPSELSILDYHRIGRKGERVNQLMGEDRDLTDDEVQEFRVLLDAMTRIILRAPSDVHERFTDTQRLQIINVFTELSGVKKGSPETADPAGSPNGEK